MSILYPIIVLKCLHRSQIGKTYEEAPKPAKASDQGACDACCSVNGDVDRAIGSAMAIYRDPETGILHGAADPRAEDGGAVAY